MSTELFDYIQAVKPSLGDAERTKISLLLMHYITLARVSDGRVRIDNALTVSGGSFVRKVLRNMSIVRGLAFALRVDMSCLYDDSPIPEGLRRLCKKYYIDVDASIRRNKKLEDARGEMWDLVIFVRVALAVMAALHEDTLCSLDEFYRGHRPVGYKPKPKWFGLRTDDCIPPILARDLPRAKACRAVGIKASTALTSNSGTILMAFWILVVTLASRLLFGSLFSSSSAHTLSSKYSTYNQLRLETKANPPPPSMKVILLLVFDGRTYKIHSRCRAEWNDDDEKNDWWLLYCEWMRRARIQRVGRWMAERWQLSDLEQ
ncbi:hypothetical protein OPQ81_001782 [Rhizoctonia solani]|nr:hypothetical protein OPQ81_001782 [Rhizoctonia solani]